MTVSKADRRWDALLLLLSLSLRVGQLPQGVSNSELLLIAIWFTTRFCCVVCALSLYILFLSASWASLVCSVLVPVLGMHGV